MSNADEASPVQGIVMCDERMKILEDALDHIAKIAGMARVPTRRLNWISARARYALAGKPYDRDALPRYPRTRAHNSFLDSSRT